MNLSVCTLYEKNYHYGLAVLINSLVAHGYTGDVYVGYRGDLPLWARELKMDKWGSWAGAKLMSPTEGLNLHFLPIKTTVHFTNYKPTFIKAVSDRLENKVDGIFYFDPDIVINENWEFFQNWIQCGIALCEDVNSPVSKNDPIRVGWRRFFKTEPTWKTNTYVNGGCVGILTTSIGFLKEWEEHLVICFSSIGGGDKVGIGEEAKAHTQKGFGNCFTQPDQDCINATVERTEESLFSILNKRAMAFEPGHASLPHAIGSWKPWQRGYINRALKGTPPRMVDKCFWEHVNSPITPFSPRQVLLTKISLRIASFIGRFYSRR